MALQIDVKKVSVTQPTGKTGYQIILNLKMWNEGDNPLTDDPVFDQNFSEYLKTQVEGTTEAQLFQRVQLALGKVMQAAINRYKLETAAYNKAILDTMVTNIKNGLTG